MSPTILKTLNIRIMIYPKDHLPPHVHAIGPEGEAKFEIETLDCIYVRGFSQKTVWRIQVLLRKNQSFLKEAWDEWQK